MFLLVFLKTGSTQAPHSCFVYQASNCRGGPPWPPVPPQAGGHGGPPLQLIQLDPPVVHVDDAVGPAYRVGAVGDDDCGYVAEMLIESGQQTLLGELIER